MNFKKAALLVGVFGVCAMLVQSSPKLDERTYQEIVASQPAVGDVVFTRKGGPIFSNVAATTLSWSSHVGIIVDFKDGDWVVAESGIPVVRKTPLKKFIGHSEKHAFAIKRLKAEPTENDKRLMLRFADSQLGKFYSLGFDLESRKTFCSKFVHEVVYVSTRQSLGEVETFEHLLRRNPEAPMKFWKTWFLGSIPWERKTITPASELESPLLRTIIEHHT